MPCQSLPQVLKPQFVGQGVLTNEGIAARLIFHFPTEGPGKKVEAGSKLSRRILEEGIKQKDPFLFGIGLHVYQDSWSHEGYSPMLGHAVDGHDPDRPYKDVAKATAMAKATYEALVEYRKAVYPERQERLKWDDKDFQALLKDRLSHKNEKEQTRAAAWLGDLDATFRGIMRKETKNETWKPQGFPIWRTAHEFEKFDAERYKLFEEAMKAALKMPAPWQVTPEHIRDLIRTVEGLRNK
jgi:hypothetical protein